MKHQADSKARTSPRLAKLTRPKLHAALARERLFAKLDACRHQAVLWISGPPGAGKTTLVATWLDKRRNPGLWYQADAGDGDAATFFFYLREAAIASGVKTLDGLPLLSPERSADLPGFARRWFRDLFAMLPVGATVTLDNYQEIPIESPLHRALAEACEEIPEGSQLIFLSWSEPTTDYARLAVREQIARIEWQDLKLSIEETRMIGTDLDEHTLQELHTQCDGWAAGFTLLRSRYRQTGLVSQMDQAGSMQNVFDYFMAQAFRDASQENQDTLVRTAFLPRFTIPMAVEISGNPKAGELFDWLYRKHLFVDRRYGDLVTYQYHALFRTFLLARALELYPEGSVNELNGRAARILADAGQGDDAVGLYLKACDWRAAAELILRLTPKLSAAGRGQTIRNWVAVLPSQVVEKTPGLNYLLGMAMLTIDPGDAYARLERAYHGFVSTGDRSGQLLAAGGCLSALYAGYTDMRPGQQWLSVLEPLLEDGTLFPSLEAEANLLSSLLVFTFVAAPLHPLNPRCTQRLLDLLHEPIDSNRRIVAASRLLGPLGLHGHIEMGRKLVALLEPVLKKPDVTEFSRASWSSGYQAFLLNAGDYTEEERIAAEHERIFVENRLGVGRGLFIYVGTLMLHAEIYVDRGDLDGALSINERRRRRISLQQSKPHSDALIEARVAAAKGQMDPARSALDEALLDMRRHGYALAGGPCNYLVAAVLVMLGDLDRAQELIEDSLRQIGDYPMPAIVCGLKLVQARIDDLRGQHDTSLALLRVVLAKMREARLGALTRTGPILRWACQTALRHGIETEYVRTIVRNMSMPPPSPDEPRWPWPLKVRTLGGFGVEVNGEPLKLGAKAPRRLLELLQASIALGQGASTEKLCAVLWPEAEGDAAEIAFRTALSRLRKLLGSDEILVHKEGRLALNEKRCWVDLWSTERLFDEIDEAPADDHAERLLELYRGAFLETATERAWMLEPRETLRTRFVTAVTRVGERLERHGEPEKALDLYRRALEQDAVAEGVYRRLMLVHLSLGQTAEALAAYRRCSQMLSVVLGVKPSPQTEALRRKLSA